MVLHELLSFPPLIQFMELAAILTLIEWLLLVSGRKFSLGAPITERSLHKVFTPTGGGIIWIIAAVLGFLLFANLTVFQSWVFIVGIIALGIISFIDDVHPLPPIPRLISQIIVVSLSFIQLCQPTAFDIFLLVIFCGVGIINAINFLDGICGMLALYGLVVTSSFLYAIYTLAIPELLWLMPVLEMVIIAQIVFACFNLKDVIFAGDVGSITLGYIQIFAAISLVLITGDGSYLIFFGVCIFDTGLTTLQRLFSGISILIPHRMNIYQLLTTEKGIPHVVVSIIYALLQLLINALFFLIPHSQHWTYFLLVSALLTITYFGVRFSFRKPIN